MRHRLTTRQREELYRSECEKAVAAGRGDFPICNICDLPIIPGSLWDASHQKHKPRWLNGVIEGCAHARCNRHHGAKVDTPLFAKNERVRKKFMDFTRSRTPLPGGRDDDIRKKTSGLVVLRSTGEPAWRGRS